MADKEKQQERGRGSNVFLGTDPVQRAWQTPQNLMATWNCPGSKHFGKEIFIISQVR